MYLRRPTTSDVTPPDAHEGAYGYLIERWAWEASRPWSSDWLLAGGLE
ncbi:hypothetical protein ACFSEO_01275 [Agromyces cerinus subsp. nitratus]